jgi:hypothetical protein
MIRMTPGATGQRGHHSIVHALIAGELALDFTLVLAVLCSARAMRV